MKKTIIIFALACMLFSCKTSSNFTSRKAKTEFIKNKPGNDGSSYEKAIVIEETTESKGVPAEYVWIRENYPHSSIQGQSLMHKNDRSYDVIKITTASGDEKSIYFDISNFFGNM